MSTALVATTTVYNGDGTVAAESSHPSFHVAWSQVMRVLRNMEYKLMTYEATDDFLEALDEAWDDIPSDLNAPGELQVMVADIPGYLFKVTAYKPVGS